MCTRGERRKKTFSKSNRNAKLFKTVTGYSLDNVGRYKKCKYLECRSDSERTNSEWNGKRNYKYGDKKRFARSEDELKNIV